MTPSGECECPYCTGEACHPCGFGHGLRTGQPPCDHDVTDRHGDEDCLDPEPWEPDPPFKPRWYHERVPLDMPMSPMQVTHRRVEAAIPEPIARLAYAEYARQGHGEQSFERINERGGFSDMEIIHLLADALERKDDGIPAIGDAPDPTWPKQKEQEG